MGTIQHGLQQSNPGMVWLDNDNRIVAMNAVAIEAFGERPEDLIDREILPMHPESSRDNVKWLLDQSSCPAGALGAGAAAYQGSIPQLDLFAPARNLQSLQALEPVLTGL